MAALVWIASPAVLRGRNDGNTAGARDDGRMNMRPYDNLDTLLRVPTSLLIPYVCNRCFRKSMNTVCIYQTQCWMGGFE